MFSTQDERARPTRGLLRPLRRVGRWIPPALRRRVPFALRQRIRAVLGLPAEPPPRQPRHRDDDFNWRDYTRDYEPQVDEGEKRWTLRIREGDYGFVDGSLTRQREVKPLHPVVWAMLETILRLGPASVTDVGCGSGDNLHNLRLLRPALELFGCDVSEGQLAFAGRRHPELGIPLVRCDLTLADEVRGLPQADVVYCKTVIMHIKTGRTHEDALCNLFLRARAQVVLMENWERHAFLEDLQRLQRDGRLAWPTVHFHYHVREGTEGPHALIASREPLRSFPVLTDYGVLRFA